MCCYVVSETAPPYLSDLLHLYIPSCSLHSSADTHTFRILKGKKQFQGQRTFPHLGPVTWNKLPYSLAVCAMLQQNPGSKLNSKPHHSSQPMDQTPKCLCFRCQSYPHPPPHPHFLLTCLYRCMRACVCVLRVCMCVCVCYEVSECVFLLIFYFIF